MRKLLAVPVILAVLALASPAWAASVSLSRFGTLAPDGSSFTVEVTVICEPGQTVLEALVYRADQRGTTSTGGVSGIECTGAPDEALATVHVIEGTYRPGPATVGVFVLLCEGFDCGESADTGSQRIILRPR